MDFHGNKTCHDIPDNHQRENVTCPWGYLAITNFTCDQPTSPVIKLSPTIRHPVPLNAKDEAASPTKQPDENV